MEITEIKSKLEITQLAQHLGIKLNKANKALCPFHNDKTPSLQFSKEKQICTCFSSNCNAGTMDIISLTEKKLNLNKHESLKYLSNLAGESTVKTQNIASQSPTKATAEQEPNYQTDFEQMQSSFLSSSTARKYTENRAIKYWGVEIGYNAFKSSKFNYLRGCIIFPLKDKNKKIVSLYGRSIRNNDNAKHYYTKDRKGLYPNYPHPKTKILILTEAIIDALTLQCVINKEQLTILALYGTNGLTQEHKQAIKELEHLEEIILFFDGDKAGEQAYEKHSKYLHQIFPKITISKVETPQDEDINSLTQTYPEDYEKVINQLIKTRETFLFSEENKEEEKQQKEIKPQTQTTHNTQLIIHNPNKIEYQSQTATYYIKGGLPKGLDSLKITLEIQNHKTSRKSRTKPDLYEDKQVEKVSREAGEKLSIRADLIELDLNHLTDLLDEYREQQQQKEQEEKPEKPTLTAEEQAQSIKFLKHNNLIKNINKLIEKAGITGESNNRLFLFVIATSYKMPDTLHALIQGSSGSGKTYLSRQITDLMPKEDVIRLTRVTESSFYNYGEYELQYKLIVLEDVDGLKEEAEYAFRELQSNGEIISSTSAKDENSGQIRAQIRRVKGPIGSIATTTHGEIYEDNMSRIFLLAVDESKEQTNRIINYLNQKSSGMINKTEETQTKNFIQNCIRMLKPYQVINPYANKILLPPEAHKIRRLTELYHAFINQITLINQYQRKKDEQGRLITEKEDVKIAIEIMFESIVLKVDELDGSLRQFYERLKEYIQKQGEEYKNYQFTQREIRMELNISKTSCQNYINRLLEFEYITRTVTGQRNTFHYKIEYWDSLQILRDKIKTYLNNQLENL